MFVSSSCQFTNKRVRHSQSSPQSALDTEYRVSESKPDSDDRANRYIAPKGGVPTVRESVEARRKIALMVRAKEIDARGMIM